MSIADALDGVVTLLTDAGLQATRDAGAFYPQSVACLVGMPTVVTSGLQYRTLQVPVHVVSADPPSSSSVDAMYAVADTAARALKTNSYEPADWTGGPNADALPSILITATVSVQITSPEEG